MKKTFQPAGDPTKDKKVLTLFEKEIGLTIKSTKFVAEEKVTDFLERCVSYSKYYGEEVKDSGTALECAHASARVANDDAIMAFITSAPSRVKIARAVFRNAEIMADLFGDTELAELASAKRAELKKAAKALKEVVVAEEQKKDEGAEKFINEESGPEKGVISTDEGTDRENAPVVMAEEPTLSKKVYEATKNKTKDLRVLELLEKELTMRRTALELQGATPQEMALTYGMQEKVVSFIDRCISYSKTYLEDGDKQTALECAKAAARVASDDSVMSVVVKSMTFAKTKARAFANMATVCKECEEASDILELALQNEKESRRALKAAKRKAAMRLHHGGEVHEDDLCEPVVVVNQVRSTTPVPASHEPESLLDLVEQLASDKLPTLDAVDAYTTPSTRTLGLGALMANREKMDSQYLESRLQCMLETIQQNRMNAFRVYLDELGEGIASQHVGAWVQCASASNSTAILQYLVETYHADVESPNKDGATLLHLACQNGNLQLCKDLLRFGAHVDAQDGRRRTPLMVACLARSQDVVLFLLRQPLDLSLADNKGNHVLHYAHHVGLTTVVIHLLDSGAMAHAYRPDLSSDSQRVVAACAAGHCDVALMIIQYGSMSLEETDELGRTALHYCAKNVLASIVAEVCTRVSYVDPVDQDGMTPLHIAASRSVQVSRILLNVGADVAVEDAKGNTPLLYACHANQEQVAILLLDCGASPNHKNHSGNTALHYATMNGMSAVAAYLVQLGADVNAPDDKGDTALLFACHNGNTILAAQVLRCKDIDVNVMNLKGYTPLLCALSNSMSDIALALIQAGADINTCDPRNNSPLCFACHAGLEVVCFEIIQRGGVDVHVANEFGNTALHYAAASNMLGVIKLLLECGVDVNVTDTAQCTPLHYAALHSRSEAAALLIEQGASIHTVNVMGNTPVDHAMLKVH